MDARRRLGETEAQLLRMTAKDAQRPLDREERHAVVNALTLVMAYRNLLDEEAEPPDDELLADAHGALLRAAELTEELARV